MSGGGKDISAQLSRQLVQALDQSGDDEGATEETTTSASGENSQSPVKLEDSGSGASKDTTDKGQYLSVFFFGGDGTEFKIDLTKAIDAGAVGRIACEPARDVLLDRNNSVPQKPDTTTCAGTATTSESTESSKPKRRHPKLVESGPAEHIGEGWTYKTYQRMNGATEGQTDTYWFSPVLRKKFRSRKEIHRFLKMYNDARSTLIASGVNTADVDSINGGLLESTAWEQFRTASSISCDEYQNISHKSWAQSAIEAAGDIEKTNSHPWTKRIRAKLKEMQYEGDVDAIVATILAELGTMVERHPDTRIMETKHLLEEVVEQCVPWEGRIRTRLTEMQYKGNIDAMVATVLADLRTIIDPNDPLKKKRLTNLLLEDAVKRCTGRCTDSLEGSVYQQQHWPQNGSSVVHGASGKALGDLSRASTSVPAFFLEGLKQRPQNAPPLVLGPLGKPFRDLPHPMIPKPRHLPQHAMAIPVPMPQSQPVVMIPVPRPPPQLFVWHQHRAETVARGGISHPIVTAKKRPREGENMRSSEFPHKPPPYQEQLPPLSDFSYWLFSLINFKKFYGHIDVASHQETERDAMLLSFLNDLRERYRTNTIDPATLSIAQIQALESIGINFPSYVPDEWNAPPQLKKMKKRWYPKKVVTFDERIEQLRQFKELHGHCKPTKGGSEDDFPGLANFCYLQRCYMKKKMAGDELGAKLLPDEKENKLREIGIDFFDHFRCTWKDRLEQLKRFKELHGHCRPRQKESTGDFEGIYRWCVHQRLYLRKKIAGDEDGKKKLPDSKEKELREIGFVFNDEE